MIKTSILCEQKNQPDGQSDLVRFYAVAADVGEIESSYSKAQIMSKK